jgi:hypothetical protein
MPFYILEVHLLFFVKANDCELRIEFEFISSNCVIFSNLMFIDFQVNRPDNHRRKWDKDEFEKKAKERDDEEKEKRREHAKGMNDAAMIRATAKASGT